MKKNNKKKLPRFALGTRHPMYMGYQRNQGIGAANVTTTKGEDLQPEVDAMRANQIPNAFNGLQQNSVMPMQMLQDTKQISATSNLLQKPPVTMQTIRNSISNPLTYYNKLNSFNPVQTNAAWSSFANSPNLSFATKGVGSAANSLSPAMSASGSLQYTLPSLTTSSNLASTGFAGLGETNPATFFGNTSELAGGAGQSAGTTAGKQVLGAAGKVAGVLGAAYSGSKVVNDILHAGDIRSIGQMRNTRDINTVTTAGGNTYKEYGAANASAEREYERQSALGKKIGLTTDAMGLGASIGGLAGPIGMGIGAAAGLVLGGAASLLGFGDNEEDVQHNLDVLAEETSRTNRQNKSIAESQDVKDAFYNRAENGKQPVWTPAGLANGKATALVSNGELIGNFEDGYVSRVPGKKNNKDTVAAALKGSDFVISNKYGLSDYAAATGDYTGALNMQNMLLNHYCKGKMPKYAFGTLGDYALTTLPHFGAFMTHLANRRRISEAPTETNDTFVQDSLGADALDQLGSFRFNELPYVRDAQRGLNQANWDVRRNVGLGIGGRAIAANANFRQYLDALQKIHTTANEQNNQLRANYANAKMQYGANEQARRMQALQQMHQWRQQANAAKENMMATEGNNILMSTLDAAKDFLSMKQYKQAFGIQNKMLGLYQQQANLDQDKYNALIDNLGKSSAIPQQSASTWTPPLWLQRSYIPTGFGSIDQYNWRLQR